MPTHAAAPGADTTAAPGGLTEAEAAARLAARGGSPAPAQSRSYGSIVRANTFTVFNAILAGFGVLTLAFGDWRDAMFLGVLVGNMTIGIAQEVRAKRALDRLAALVVPVATVVRDGRPRTAAVGELVPGDLVRVQAGDQIVADGQLVEAIALSLDESVLTGETQPVPRGVGDTVHSGSFVAEGVGAYLIAAVGPDSLAERIAGEARAFRHPRSPLEHALDRLLLGLVALLVPLAVVLTVRLWLGDRPLDEALPIAVAGIVNLVPEGLLLLTSLTFAVGAIRMARHGALAQQLNAIESLAAADVVCFDKTGTLTEPQPVVLRIVPAAGISEPELAAALRLLVATAPGHNRTLQAIADAYPSPPVAAEGVVPFSSTRRYSAVRTAGWTTVLSAPELVALGPLAVSVRQEQELGRRVLAISRTGSVVGDGGLPARLAALGLVVLGERLRPEARETVAFLAGQGVALVVLSGDASETARRVAAEAGLEAGRPLSGGALPAEPAELVEAVLAARVVGRVAPDEKRRIVEALSEAGHHVAMVGDGVNDVPALKAARLAIAQGSGVQMARSVSDLVLVSGEFAAVPRLVAEGRQILRNVQRVARLFVTKSVLAALLIVTVGMTGYPYPLLPRQLTIVSVLAVGLPGFVLAIASSHGPWEVARFRRTVVGFSLAAGASVAAGTVVAYSLALGSFDLGVREVRTVATTVLVAFWLVLILLVESSGRRLLVAALCLAMAGLYALALLLPESREFFRLTLPGPSGWAAVACGFAVAVVGLAASIRNFPHIDRGHAGCTDREARGRSPA